MEDKYFPKNQKQLKKHEKFISEISYSQYIKEVSDHKRPFVINLEILHKNPKEKPNNEHYRRLLISIKPKVPITESIFVADNDHFVKNLENTSSCETVFETSMTSSAEYKTRIRNLNSCSASETDSSRSSSVTEYSISSKSYYYNRNKDIRCSEYKSKMKSANIPQDTSDDPELVILDQSERNNPSRNSLRRQSRNSFNRLNKRIKHLETRVQKGIIFRNKTTSGELNSSVGRPGCSYIEQYSHIPQTSAFHRYAHQAMPLSPSKGTTIEKEHNSEQYSRDFTTYDGITARGRRQCASVPCKREDTPKIVSDRVHKIRHKLNPVRDYRLMDTVHYLAQGEFAPRDDGIKLTPSREAVLSDIIWEDVCRTHWPNTRFARRNAQQERCNTRCELQRLIDGLLRERVAHIERRRRRHYKVVKMNNRQENCRQLGKTGDIIVASHKNSQDERDVSYPKNASSPAIDKHCRQHSHRGKRSHDILQRRRVMPDYCSPGTSYAATRRPSNDCATATCCITSNRERRQEVLNQNTKRTTEVSSSSSSVSGNRKSPRLLLKKDSFRRRYRTPDENLEHYILLPTLVVKTPSNVKRQKKFNELYHRIVNMQTPVKVTDVEDKRKDRTKTREIGLNINVNVSDSNEDIC